MNSTPAPPSLRWVMTIEVDVAEPLELGTSHGVVRRIIPIIGGRFEGPELRGEVLSFGADWQHIQPDGTAVLDARYALKTEGGDIISVSNRGFRHGSPRLATRFGSSERIKPAEYYFMTAPSFETSAASLQWLTRTIFVGAGERDRSRVTLNIWRVGDDPIFYP